MPDKYQLLGKLRQEEYDALKADIEARGVKVPVEIDENGQILDGHHRVEIADKLGKPYKTITRKFKTEEEKKEHVYKLNLCRRHLDGIRWGLAFTKLCELKEVPLGKAGRPKDGCEKNCATVAQLAGELGVPVRTAQHRVRKARAYEALPKKEREAIDRGDKKLSEACREQSKAKKTKTAMELPKGKYRVFYADPPWKYRDSGAEKDNYGPAERHYDAMSIEELCEMPIKKRAAKDSVLFLWVTAPLLFECEPVIKAWGFKYKTNAVWDKVGHNYGHYFSVRHELLLVCVRGSCTPDIEERIGSVIRVKKTGKHSEKPEEFRAIIEKLYPHGRRIELFARSRHPGWDTYGDQIDE